MRRLTMTRDPDHDTEAFQLLVLKPVEAVHQLPSPILAVGDGSIVVVGVCPCCTRWPTAMRFGIS